jgi:hypothetical protein
MIEHLSFERAVDEYVGMCRVRDGHNFIPRQRELLFMELGFSTFTFLQESSKQSDRLAATALKTGIVVGFTSSVVTTVGVVII